MSCALNCISTFLFRYVVFGNLYMYLYLNVFIQVHCVWYFIHVLISQCFYSCTLCLVLYTCTYISMFLFRYVVFGTLCMYLYLNVFIQVHCVWYFIHVLISQCLYSGTLYLVLYTCTYISMFLFRYVVFGTLYMYLYLNIFIQVHCVWYFIHVLISQCFIQVHCVWYFIHVLISQCFYSGTLCLIIYTCTYISMFLFRYLVFGTLYMYLYLNVFIQVHCVWYFIHVLISQCFYSGTLCLVLYTCTYISMFLFRYIVFDNLYMYLYLNVFICLNRNKLFPHFIYCIFIPKIVKMGSKLLVCHYYLSMV